MTETWTFHGPYATVYPELRGPQGGTLIAVPGETELDFDPGDGNWWPGNEPPEPREDASAGPTAHDASPNPALTGESAPDMFSDGYEASAP